MAKDLEEEDREWLERLLTRTEETCAKCDDRIHLGDEVFLIVVSVPTLMNDGTVEFIPATCDDDDYLYQPRFVEFPCWENAVEELQKTVRDLPAIEDNRGITECFSCESSILLGEHTAVVTLGELEVSNRCPNNETVHTFHPNDKTPQVFCVSCLLRLNEDRDLWDAEVRQGNECAEGTHYRCWRYGCAGSDACHALLRSTG